MTLLEFSKIIFNNWRILVLSAILCSTAVFLFTKNEQKTFSSRMVLNTGVVSGYNIENHDSNQRIDRDFTRNELERLISLAKAYETLEELSIQLIAAYLLSSDSTDQFLLPENQMEVESLINSPTREILMDTSKQAIVAKIKAMKSSDRINPIYQLIYSDHPFFGIEQLEQIRVNRKGASDLLEFNYATIDPLVCKQTLEEMAGIFIRKNKSLKERQSEDVLGFFEKATRESAAKLRAAEEKLLQFQVKNNIINYYEQTRFIADKKEDLDELFFKEVMDLEATRSSLIRIEEQLEGRLEVKELNHLLAEKRAEISQVANRLAESDIGADTSPSIAASTVRKRFHLLEKEIQDLALTSFNLDQTPAGIARKELLSNWLKATIQLEEAGARLEVIKNRKQEFKEVYSQFAPWGSSLKKIEREIALAEDAYLENLHSYNQARLHLQNTTMASNLNLLDAPYYPTKEGASKRLLLLVVAFGLGLFLPLSILIGLAFLDQTLKDPNRAELMIGAPLLGAYPLFPYKKLKGTAGIDFALLRQRSSHLIQQHMFRNAHPKARIWGFASTRGKEGSSFVMGLQAELLRRQGKRVLVLTPIVQDAQKEPLVDHQDNHQYYPEDLKDRLSYEEEQEWDYIYLELPPLLNGTLAFLQGDIIDQGVLVCQSSRVWTTADQKAAEHLKYLSFAKVGFILNAAPIQAMDKLLGEVPRKRSRIRRNVKKRLRLNFS